MQYKIKDISLKDEGHKKLDWARDHMPVLQYFREKYKKEKPLKGQRIAGCLHVTKETAILVEALVDAGAEVAWCGCNPLSTQDDVAAALADQGVPIFAWYGMSREEFYWAIDKVLEIKPTLTLDDGADLIVRVHTEKTEYIEGIIGGTEETTTGVERLRALHKAGKLKYPVFAVNDAITKWDFDNVYGTGQSSVDGILRATSVLLAGKTFVVAGYGHCGRGVAMRARGMGARVVVTEVIATQALKAALEGFEVMPMDKACEIGDIFITATGMKDVIRGRHIEKMKSGAILSNTGHYDCEINLKELEELTKEKREIRPHCEEYLLKNGKKIYLLAKGRLVNLVAAEGHPSEVMDMSFANQFLCLIRMAREGEKMPLGVHPVPREQDEEIARKKLQLMGFEIDELTEDQIQYKESYWEGT